MRRIALVVVGFLAALCCAWLGLLAWYDGERIRSSVSGRLAERYGVALSIGQLERTWSLRPRITLQNMEVANAQQRDRVLIEVDSASFRIHPWSLLVGPLTLDDIVVDGLRISVPVDDDGALYWDPLVEAMSQWLHRFDWSLRQFSVRNLHTESRHVERGNDLLVSAERIDGAMPRPEDLAISASGVNANLETALPLRLHGTARLEKLALERQDGELPVKLTVAGHVGDKVLRIDASGGNLLAGDPVERDPLQARIELGPAVAELRGTMSRDDPTHLALNVVFDKPAKGGPGGTDGKRGRKPLHVEMGVSDPGTSWRLTDIRAVQGDSTLSGTIEVGNEGERRFFGGSLTVTNVSYPETDEEETGDEKGVRDVLPSGDLFAHLVEFIREFDADFTLNARESRLLGIPFRQITLRTTLDRGALLATIEDSKIRDTSLESRFSVSPAEGGAKLDLDASLRDADVSALLAGVEKLSGVTGTFDGELRLHATGDDTASVLGSTAGRLQLYLANGAMPDRLATRIAGDVFTALLADFEENDKTEIRCAIVDLEVDEGVARSREMMMDTGEFRMQGEGRIELSKGFMDIELVPRAKDFSLVSIQLPLRVYGPLNELKLNPDVSEGVASLLTPIELGDREKADCSPPALAARRMPRSGSP